MTAPEATQDATPNTRQSPIRLVFRFFVVPMLIVAGLLAIIYGGRDGMGGQMVAAMAKAKPHAPDWGFLLSLPPVIQIHIAAVFVAFAIGIWQFVGKKGKLTHRILGWTWVLMMGAAAISSLFIKTINPGHFSLIHILSVATLITLPQIIWYARKHNVKKHASNAIGLYIGALIVAGIFAFMPGRVMWHVFFG